jgi:hypothetical protein
MVTGRRDVKVGELDKPEVPAGFETHSKFAKAAVDDTRQ